MSDQSSAMLEREAEAAREKMADTAASIRKKLTAGQMIDEFSDLFSGSDVSTMTRNFGAQVRDNPLPLALVGAGLAWLVLGRGSGPTGSHERDFPRRTSSEPHSPSPSDGDQSMMSSVVEGAKSAAASVGEVASDAVSGATDSLSEAARRLRQGVSAYAPRNAADLVDQEPLLIAAMGLTLGAVVGAMLPTTEFEREQIGAQADRLREGVEGLVEKGREGADRIASKAYDALKQEADRQSLASDGPSVGERVSKVVKSAVDAASDATREELGAGSEKAEKPTASR